MHRAVGTTLIRGTIVALVVAACCFVGVSLLVKLPSEPMLRAVALAVPFLAGGAIAIGWFEAGAPWLPTRSADRHRQSSVIGARSRGNALPDRQ